MSFSSFLRSNSISNFNESNSHQKSISEEIELFKAAVETSTSMTCKGPIYILHNDHHKVTLTLQVFTLNSQTLTIKNENKELATFTLTANEVQNLSVEITSEIAALGDTVKMTFKVAIK